MSAAIAETYTIGLLGTGAVARALAGNLQRAGHTVIFLVRAIGTPTVNISVHHAPLP